MPGCGYICPKCNDSGFDEELKPCDWCSQAPPISRKTASPLPSEEDWLKSVHEGPCCGDLGQAAHHLDKK